MKAVVYESLWPLKDGERNGTADGGSSSRTRSGEQPASR